MNLFSKFNASLITNLFLFLIHHTAFSQPENISFEHFTNENGLSAPVTHIKQDHLGFLWLGTTDGLNRFDGRNFIVYRNIKGDSTSLSNNIINDICVDHSGRIWVATNGGLCTYNFSNDAFHTLVFNDTLEKIDRYRVHAVTEGKDHSIWFATKTLLHVWREGQPVKDFSLPPGENYINKFLYADTNNRIWIGSNNGLSVFDEKTNKFIQTKLSSPFSIEKKLLITVHPILPWHGDTLLTGSWYGGLQKLFISGDKIISMPIIDSVETDPRRHIVTGFTKGNSSQLWVGTYGNGLAIYDESIKNFTRHFHHNPSNRKSLSNDYVNDVFADASGIIWIGTTTGLDKFDPLTQQFKSIPVPMYASEFSVYRLPSSITTDRKNPDWLWITVSGAGLFHFNTKSQEFKLFSNDVKNPSSLPDNNLYTLFYDEQDRIWIGSKNGVCIFDDASGKISIPLMGEKNVLAGVHEIFQDSLKRFWLATFSNGLYCYDESEKKLITYKYDESDPNSLPDNRIFCMLQDSRQNIWIGTQNRGLCCLNMKTSKLRYFQYDKNDMSSIPDNGIYDLYEDKNNHLWIATENGLAEMNLNDFKIKTYTSTDGLCNNDIFSITPDKQGQLWLGSNNGLSRFDPERNIFKNYYINDGLPSNKIDGAVYCNDDGTFYFGTSGMLSYCRPEDMKMNSRIPPVVITNFRIFDRQVAVMRKDEMLQPIHLSYKQNMITFEFAALNFTNTHLNNYAYKLEGFDNNWIDCGNKQSATYTNLDGGEYNFIVKAANNDGVWNPEGTHVLLIIDDPWWKTWWFYILCIATIAGILFAIYRVRINQLLQLQNIRMRISRDLHDDIGSTLSSINMISSMANTADTTVKKSSENFKTISSASRQAMELMNDIVWSINPKNDRMDMIVIRIRQYASEMLEAAHISFAIDIDDECMQLSLPVEKKKNFYLIFKEAINNLTKYSEGDTVSIQIKYINRMIKLIIRDNGKGFDASEEYSGNGLKNMRVRAMQLNGEVSIHSGPGAGTAIELIFPVP